MNPKIRPSKNNLKNNELISRMSDRQVLTENEEIDPEIMTDHGVKTDNKKLYTAVG